MPHEALTAQQRFDSLRRARRKAQHRRLVRQSAGELWKRWMRHPPILFCLQGEMVVHELRAGRDEVIAALRHTGVFTLDTAAELRWGVRLVRGNDVHAYLADREALDHLVNAGLVSQTPLQTKVLFPPHSVHPRLVVVVVESLPPSEVTPNGYRVVEADRLVREFIGAVGMRADLAALLEEYVRRERGEP
jgi:hypothetical protein